MTKFNKGVDIMNYVYGSLMIIIGLFFTISAFLESDFIVYRILTARSRQLWKDNVHHFYKVVGILIIIVGFLFILEVF
jgi:uncharacterized membrane protein YphA (DoxX/SURF4 family)